MQYWNQLANDHGINPDGAIEQSSTDTTNAQSHRPEIFFNLSDQSKYTPRSILIDLEPSVVNKVTHALPMVNPRNVHLSEKGNGAANNWSNGYSYGLSHQEDLINLIDREIDKCDNFNNFQLFHSVAGGTGSGVGSLILETLNDRYGSKKLINTFLIFPSNEKTSDVVVQPYNTILTLKRLIDFSDASIVFHNDALNSMENLLFHNSRHQSDAAFELTNKLISNVCANISNPFRFPNYMYSSYESIFSSLIPTPDLKFLSASIAPFTSNRHNMNEYDIILELLNDQYKMNRVTEIPKYISVMNYLIGNNLSQQEIRKGALKARQRIDFVPWASSSVQMVNGKRPAFLKTENPKQITGVQLSNNTSIIDVFKRIIKQYELLVKREAYINSYTESNAREEKVRVLEMFNECRESIMNVIDEYQSCQLVNYLNDEIFDEDEL